MDILVIIKEAIVGSWDSLFGIAIIVFPLMLALEVAKDLKVLEWLTGFTRPLLRLFAIPEEAGLPLLAGLIFGFSYGAGAIIQSAREGKLSERDLVIVNTFLVVCHSVLEDTLLFVAIGAQGWLILFFRLLAALVITFAVARYTGKNRGLGAETSMNIK